MHDYSMHNGTTADCFSWAVVVGVLDKIVCERGEPVFGKSQAVGEPRVEELMLSRRSCHDDVQGCICSRVGWYVCNIPRRQKKNTLNYFERQF